MRANAALKRVLQRHKRRWAPVGDFKPADLFRKGKAEYRRRKNKTPCPECGSTDLVYRWLKCEWNDGKDTRWFCFCGRTEVDD